MSKKSKNRYAKFKSAAKTNSPVPSYANTASVPTSVAPTMDRPILANSYSAIRNWPIGKELRAIGLTFALLIILLVAISTVNQKTTAISSLSNKISHMLHIEE